MTSLTAPARIVLVALALTAGAAAPASADPHPRHVGVVAADPADHTPDVLDGHVNAFAQVGDTMVVGGSFTRVAQGDVAYRRSNLFAFSLSTGRVLRAFAPRVDGEVFDLQAMPAGTVMAGGAFGSVDAVPGTSKLAVLRVETGAVDPHFTSPRPNALVRDIVTARGRYYIAGSFRTLGGHPRSYVAALNPDGSDSGVVDLTITGTNAGGSTHVRSMDVSPDGTRLVIAGNFAAVDGHRRDQVAVLDLRSSETRLDPWSTTAFAPQCGPRFQAYLRDVAIAPNGRYFVAVTTGGPRGDQRSGRLCDSASRFPLDHAADARPTWVAYTGGDTLTAAIVDSHAVYIGGHQRWLNNGRGRNDAGPGAVPREGIAALDPLTGLPHSWNPGRSRGYGVTGFALTPEGLWIGSDTGDFGGEPRERLAFCPVVGGWPVPAYDAGTLPGRLALLLRGGGARVRAFDGRRLGAATTVDSAGWRGLRAAVAVDGALYAIWRDGRMTAQAFDGTTLGPARALPHADGFADAGRVRAAFIDPARHRLYYTLRGRPGLFARAFAPASGVVGGERTRVAGSALDWRRVRDALVVGRTLYYADSATETLRAIGWRPATGTTRGRSTAVHGPGQAVAGRRVVGMVALSGPAAASPRVATDANPISPAAPWEAKVRQP